MSESGDYEPGIWSGHNFQRARSDYDQHAGRSYAKAQESGKNRASVLPAAITTNAPAIAIFWCDVSGSTNKAPNVFFAKVPYYDHEARTEYLGEGCETMFGAVGDISYPEPDKYPLQARPFVSGTAMAEAIKELIIEGGGGGQSMESYQLAALYTQRCITAPNATTKVVIFFGDESPYPEATVDQAGQLGIELESNTPTSMIFAALKEDGYQIFFIQKAYGDERMSSSTSRRVYMNWVRLLSTDHVAQLEDTDRVIDVVFGILAQVTDKVDYFYQEIWGRQKDAKTGRPEVEKLVPVFKALRPIHGTAQLRQDGPGLPLPGDLEHGPKSRPLI